MHIPSYPPSLFPSERRGGIFIFFILTVSLLTAGVSASDNWQPVETRIWVQTDMPPGWSSSIETNATENPENVRITAYSPDQNSRLTYILDHTQEVLTKGEIQQFQNSCMSKLGFRICRTKDPVVEEKDSAISYRQTYVRGTDDAAVIGTMVYPGWGQAHYILVMEGPQAVADYYESVPVLVQDHINPVYPDKKEV